jgi:hypothetical protein
MKKFILGVAILAIAVLSNAQGGGRGMMMQGGGGNPLMLLTRDDVKKDLALTDDQNEKLTAFSDQTAMRDRFMKAMQDSGVSFEEMRTEEGRKKMAPLMEKMQADLKKEVEAILTPTQVKRLAEINVQFNGNRSVLQKDIAKAVGLTEDQNKAIADLQKKQQAAMQGLFAQVQSGELTMEDVQAKRKKNDEILDSEIGKLLTEAQKAKLKEMGGKKFDRKDEAG